MRGKLRSIVLATAFAGIGASLLWSKVIGPMRENRSSTSKPKSSKRLRPKRKTLEAPLDDSESTRSTAEAKQVAEETDEKASKPETSMPASSTGAPAVGHQLRAGARRDPMRGYLFIEFDRDGDFRLSDSELPPKHQAALGKADVDGDGMLDLAEFYVALDKLPALQEEAIVPAGRTVGNPTRGKRVPIYVPKLRRIPGKGAPDWFRTRDKDRDGQLGVKEWAGRRIEEFQRLDENADGFVTLDEAKKEAKPAKKVAEP